MADHAERSDRELFDAWRQGDKSAAGELFERHFDAIDRFFRNKLTQNYEDLVQQTFAACLESRERYRGDSSFRTYLFGIANNILRMYFRSNRRYHDRIEFTEVSALDLAPGPSTMFRVQREQQLVLECLRMIPLEYQTVLELYYWEELAASSISEVVGIPENTVRSRLRKGKQLLEKQLKKHARTPEEYERTRKDLERWAKSIHQHEDGDQQTRSAAGRS